MTHRFFLFYTRMIQPDSESSLFQVGHEGYIELSDIKAFEILPVQIDDISVRDAPAALYGEEGEFLTPGEGLFADQTVVCPVEIFDEVIG